MIHILSLILACTFLVLPSAGLAGDKVVRIFILAGQSNMEGHGRIAGKQKGTLETLARDPASAARYRHLHNDGTWITWQCQPKNESAIHFYTAIGGRQYAALDFELAGNDLVRLSKKEDYDYFCV